MHLAASRAWLSQSDGSAGQKRLNRAYGSYMLYIAYGFLVSWNFVFVEVTFVLSEPQRLLIRCAAVAARLCASMTLALLGTVHFVLCSRMPDVLAMPLIYISAFIQRSIYTSKECSRNTLSNSSSCF